MAGLIWDIICIMFLLIFMLFMAWVLKTVWYFTFGKKSNNINNKNKKHGIE